MPPEFTRQRLSRRNAAAIASIGSPQSRIAMGLANELTPTFAARVGAIDAVGAAEPSAIPMLPARLSALRCRLLPCSCGSVALTSSALGSVVMPGSSYVGALAVRGMARRYVKRWIVVEKPGRF